MSKGLGGDAFARKIHYLTFDLVVKVTQNVTQCHLYIPAKFEVAMSNSLGEAAFTRKYII